MCFSSRQLALVLLGLALCFSTVKSVPSAYPGENVVKKESTPLGSSVKTMGPPEVGASYPADTKQGYPSGGGQACTCPPPTTPTTPTPPKPEIKSPSGGYPTPDSSAASNFLTDQTKIACLAINALFALMVL